MSTSPLSSSPFPPPIPPSPSSSLYSTSTTSSTSSSSKSKATVKETIVNFEGKAMRNIMNIGQQGIRAGVLPRFQKMSWSLFLAILLVCSVPPIFSLSLFSSLGWGIEIFRQTKKVEYMVNFYIYTSILILLCLNIFDSHLWRSGRMQVFRRGLYGFCLFLFSLSVVFSCGKHPYGPLCMFALGTPIWLVISKHVLLRASFKDFVGWLPGPLFLLSISIFGYWLNWTWKGKEKEEIDVGGDSIGNEWSLDIRNKYAMEIGCAPNFEEYPECEELYNKDTLKWTTGVPTGGCSEVYDTCLDAFLIWSMPFFVSLYLFFLSHMAIYVKIDELDGAPQGFSRLIMLLIFGLWCAASMSASNAAVTNAFIAFLLFCGLSTAVVFIFVHSRKSAEERLLTPFTTMMKKYFHKYGDWFRGFAILICLPIAAMYAWLSFVTQCIRKSGLNKLVPPLKEEDRQYHLTKTASNQFSSMLTWRWSSVLQKSLIIGLCIQTMTVIITKFTYLFLAWLKVEVKSMDLFSVTLIMVIVGVTMFLFPPIPGVPIYFTSGIILVAAGEKTLGTPMAIVYTCAFNLVLKLLACTVQQKCIGTPLKRNIAVRQAVGINTDLIRTIKLVLSKKGFSTVKVATLVGGPDWPTSVLCGILDLPLFPILIGTLPVIIIIVPTVLSGSFVYLAEDYTWAGTASAISMSVTGLIIMGAPAIMLYHVEKAMEEEKEALQQMPYDQEVLIADENEEQRRLLFLDVTSWGNTRWWMKTILITGNICMGMSVYLVMGGGEMCFAKFTMKDSIERDLGGDAWSLIKFPGYIAIGLLCYG
ncbi:hypothetical protein TrVE_jg7881, partial [Triparma verrucosa]